MGYKIVFADDEPLVLVGLRSMVDWKAIGIDVAGSARRGDELLSLIKSEKPDIVISDIKMPVLSGLDVMKACQTLSDGSPEFILLTGYTDFSLVQEALRLEAVEYLVKLDLTTEGLTAAVHKALDRLGKRQPRQGSDELLKELRERFVIRLMQGLVENREQFNVQCDDLSIEVDAKAYRVALLEMRGNERGSSDELASLYASTLRIIEETLSRYLSCHAFFLDLHHAAVVFYLREGEGDSEVSHALHTSFQMAYNYVSVTVSAVVGGVVDDFYHLNDSYAAASSVPFPFEKEIRFAAPQTESGFDFSPYRTRLATAFSELDAKALKDVLSEVSQDLQKASVTPMVALFVVSNILYMTTTLLPGGEELVAQSTGGERWLSAHHTVEEYAEALDKLARCVNESLSNRRQDYRAKVVQNVQAYIKENVEKRLSLANVASVFGFSQNYLSSLFTKYGEMGFVEYTTKVKVDAAKEMLLSSDAKVYEVAQKLGFDNAFYFSKVFKKQEGISPREYVQKMLGREYKDDDDSPELK